MNQEPRFEARRHVWDACRSTQDTQRWVSYLTDLEVCDLLPFVEDFGSMVDRNGAQLPMSKWLTEQFQHGERFVRARAHDPSVPIRERLTLATFLALADRLRHLISRVAPAHVGHPRGCMMYYTDLLMSAVLVGFEFVGERIELKSGLAIPKPHAYLDPVQALNYATTRAQVDLVKLALSGPARLVAHRNVVVLVDRREHQGVFGPTIDTLFLCDWMYSRLFVRDQWVAQGAQAATEFNLLEVGCGNGLLSAAGFRDAAPLVALDAIDMDARAVLCTAQNVRRNARCSGPELADRVCLTAAPFQPARLTRQYDLILCNPPYIPVPTSHTATGVPSRLATHGTELIRELVCSAPALLRPGGSLVVVTSRLAESELIAAAGDANLEVVQETSRRVPFDIEDLDPDHLQWLIESRGLEFDNQAFHEIAIYRMRTRS